MPRRYRKKKKKTYGRRRVKQKNTSLYGQAPQFPLGKSIKTSTRYFDKGYTLAIPAAGQLARHVFSANGLYDPDITGVGHQVLGFDQMMLMFDHYTVIGSRIRVDFWNKDPSNSIMVGIGLNDDASPSLNPIVAVENGNMKYKQLSPFGAGMGARTTMTLKVNPAKFLGRSKPMSDPDLKGSISANPNEGVFYYVWAADTASDDPTTVEFSATLEYQVVYHEPKQLGSS